MAAHSGINVCTNVVTISPHPFPVPDYDQVRRGLRRHVSIWVFIREQATFICGGTRKQEVLLRNLLRPLLEEMLHVEDPTADPTAGHSLEFLAVAQQVTAQLLLCERTN